MKKRRGLTQNNNLQFFLSSNFFILLGLFFMLIFLGWKYHRARVLSFDTGENIVNFEKKTNILPSYIKSYSLGIDVEIRPAVIENGIWPVDEKTASYLLTSSTVGGGGNIIIYGHNKDDILGPIRSIKTDQLVEITGSDGNIYKYKVVKTDIVKPDDLKYIMPTNEEVLTIYTCIGFADSKRFIVVAKPL